MKINIIQLIGHADGGLGMVARNFAMYAEELGHDVRIYHDTHTKGYKMTKNIQRSSRDLEFNIFDDISVIRPAELNIIFHFNFATPQDIYRPALVSLLNRLNSSGKLQYINISHKMVKNERNFFKKNLDLMRRFDSFVGFGSGDELFSKYLLADEAMARYVKPRLYLTQHNTLFDTSKKFIGVDKKFMGQLYWQGRSPRWKGWTKYLRLKQDFADEGLQVNLLFNGINRMIGNVSVLTETMKPKKFYDWLEWDSKNFTKQKFSSFIESKTRFAGEYLREDGFLLCQQAGFTMYTSDLPRDMNFFPEYTTFEPIIAGSVLLLPDHYFLGDRGFIKEKPSDIGVVMLPGEHYSVAESAKEIRSLMSDEHKYNAYRDRAHAYFLDRGKFINTVRTIIEGGVK